MKEDKPGYETSDIDLSRAPWTLLVIVIGAIVVHVFVWWVFSFYRAEDQAVDVRRTNVAPASSIPPEPRLQVDPEEEWRQFHTDQMKTLDSYGWVSRDEQRVRIPIQRAMELMVEKGAQ